MNLEVRSILMISCGYTAREPTDQIQTPYLTIKGSLDPWEGAVVDKGYPAISGLLRILLTFLLKLSYVTSDVQGMK